MFGVFLLLTCQLIAVFDYNGVIGTGQSLAVGEQAAGNYTSSQPFNNLKISLGSKERSWPLDPADTEFSLVPLTEPLRTVAGAYPSCYPKNIYGETPHSAMANQITSLSPGTITVHTEVGENGQCLSKLKKGASDDGTTGRAYNATLFEVQAITNLAKKAGKTYGVNGFILTHGECDAGSQTYRSEIVQLYRDYVKDLSAITGQSEKPVLLISQMNSNTDSNIAAAALAVWNAQTDEPGNIILSGPKYQYLYANDGTHLQGAGYDALGEKYGEVYNEVIVKGNRDWRPLQPTSARRVDSNTVNVTFHVPNPPLQWDSTLPTPAAKSQWRSGRGFELSSGNTAIQISSAEISGTSVLIITSQALPSGSLKVGYAATSQSKRSNGTVRWGLLKDSDSTNGYGTRTVQPNWAISFEMTVDS